LAMRTIDSTSRCCLSSSLICSFASYSVSQLLLLQATAPLNPCAGRFRGHASSVTCRCMSLPVLQNWSNRYHPTGQHLSSGKRR
jgi:hypothetical protein